MKKNIVGYLGIALAALVALLILATSKATPAQNMFQLDASIAVLVLGFIAVVRGSLVWLLLCGAGIAEMVIVILKGVGH